MRENHSYSCPAWHCEFTVQVGFLPSLRAGYYTKTHDPTQLRFYQWMGAVDGSNTTADSDQWTRNVLSMIETLGAAHPNFGYFVGAHNRRSHASYCLSDSAIVSNVFTGGFASTGDGSSADQNHCTMTFDAAVNVDGFTTWLDGIINSDAAPASVTCGSNCELSGIPGCDGTLGSGGLDDKCGVCNGDGSSCVPPPVPTDYSPMCSPTALPSREGVR
eukprot:SAG31_NODE_16979_length_688_cov_0.702886_1_plen_216_part_10